MNRRVVALLTALSLLGGMVSSNGILSVQAAPKANLKKEEVQNVGRNIINFNTDWHYKKGDVLGGEKVDFVDDKWVYVNFPHTTTFYTAENKEAYLGVSWYRKHFQVDNKLKGKKLMLTFEAIMQKAEIYINGQKIKTHAGGYIPFVIDITDKVNYGKENTIALKIDSRPDRNVAPGKDKPDFQYFGGVYGNSYITATEQLHITDAVEANETAGGGVFITSPEVNKEKATVKVKTHVENEGKENKEMTMLTQIVDSSGKIVASKEDRGVIASHEKKYFHQSLYVTNPRLWSPNTPELYTVRSLVKANGVVQDSVETTYGIRKVEWKREGLYINDKKTEVEGANLHGETYMLGNAMPDNAIYEEIKRFKENGFDIVRMSHYPHRQAYYDACDKYGVMVVECASGWQYFDNSQAFKESTYAELHTDLRHKRNHPSVVAWESSLNESSYSREWAIEMNKIVKAEYPKDVESYAYTAGCYHWDVWDIGLSTPQAGIFGAGNEGAENPKYKDKPMIIAEYGDWTYGGSSSTTRVTREDKNDARKKGGDEGMLIQSDNAQESVQTIRSRGKNWLGASMYWDYADYAGFDAGMLTYCGVVDVHRIPKHSAYFYQSQKDASIDMSEYGIKTGPMVYVANTWDTKAKKEVRIFSNCDTVELFLNGKSLGEKGHDKTIWGPHGDVDPSQHPSANSGKKISAESIRNAPITFDLEKYEKGELKAIGKIKGKAVAEYVRKSPEAASRIKLRPESNAKVALDGSSAKLVWVDITDENGTVVPSAYTDVKLEVEGPGLVVGPKTITTKGGQLAVWVRSKRGEGNITLKASAKGLQTATIVIPTSKVEGMPIPVVGSDADEYEYNKTHEEIEENNIFLNKSSRASTENIENGKNEVKENANDGNDNTKWCANSGSYPQWWEVDLGASYNLDTMKLSFETVGSAYHYTIAISENPMTDETYEKHIVVDNSKGSTNTELAFEKGKVKGRYVRVTFTEATNKEWAVLRDVSGTGETDNIAFGKPVKASSVNTGQGGKVEKAEYAVDGKKDTWWCAKGGANTKNHWIQVDLKDTYKLSEVKLTFEKADAAYKFVVQGSTDGEHYVDLKDFRNGEGCGKEVTISSDEYVRYLRIQDIITKDMVNQWPAVCEIEAYGEKVDYTLSSVSREKEAFASSCKEGTEAGHGSNGVPGWYWYPATMGDEWWYIDTKGIYDIDNVQMTWNAEETHKYFIDISTDGKNWTTIADRSREGTKEIRPYESVSKIARYIRVRLPKGRTSEQGFGLFDAYAPVPTGRQVKEVKAAEKVTAFVGTEFGELQLPKEVDVVLEDDIKTTLPIKWNEADYDKTKEGKTIINGTLTEIEGVKVGENLKNTTVVVELKKDTETPVITKQPKSQTVEVGENVTFTVEAETNDGGNLTYQWQVNNGTDWQNIEGATTSSYTKENVSLEENGMKFRCLVVNTKEGMEAKQVITDEAVLTITEKPIQVNEIVSVETIQDKEVEFGTPVSALELPQTVKVQLDNNEERTLSVQWDTSSYNGNVANTYKLSGELDLTDGIVNTKGLKATVEVTVKEEPVKPEVDKEELKDIIAQAKDKATSGKYTNESVSALNEVIAKAWEIVEDKEATEEEVQQAIKDVEEAMKNLKEKETDDNNNEGNDNEGEDQNGHGNGTKVPKTSDDFHILIWLAGMLGAIKVISGRRK
ncbi:discoidin domain-containing protein [Faecalimonas sp.]